MVNRIILFLMLPSLLIAVFLVVNGVHSMPFDNTLYTFMSGVVGERFRNFVISIPNIPKIPYVNYVDGGGITILNVLITILNIMVGLINGIVIMINVIVTALNYLIALVEYVVIFIWSIVDLKDVLLQAQEQAVSVVVSL